MPQFALPVIIIFLYFPRLRIKRSLTASRKTLCDTPLFERISSAQIFHCPLQPLAHSVCLASCNNSMRLFFDRASFSCAFSICHAEFNISATTQGVRLMRNSARSVFHSFFCSQARACSSTTDFSFLSTIISETSNADRCLLLPFRVLVDSFSSVSRAESSSKSQHCFPVLARLPLHLARLAELVRGSGWFLRSG